MGYLFTLAGIIVAVFVFIYILSAIDEGKRKFREITDPFEIPGKSDYRVPGESVPGAVVTLKRNAAVDSLSEEQKEMIPKRYCPVCMSVLTRDQPLYAGNTERDGRRTILIYGCQHCYRKSADEK
ncbi:MAG: hypothetical protein PF637_07840 [Spirochaetes bacterium]|jgi:hypothetical protein|nr:hypothetical protein [Spirochaetota bacterium]